MFNNDGSGDAVMVGVRYVFLDTSFEGSTNLTNVIFALRAKNFTKPRSHHGISFMFGLPKQLIKRFVGFK